MKLCIISQYFLPDINGDVIRLLNVLDILLREGYDIVLITSFPHYPHGVIPNEYKNKLFTREVWNKVKVIRVPVIPLQHRTSIERFFLYLSFSLFAFLSIPFLGSIDVIWAFSQRLFSFIVGYPLKVIKKSYLILDMTDIWPEALVNTGHIISNGFLFQIISCVFRIVYPLCDHITTLNEQMKKILINTMNIPSTKVSILPNIINTNVFKPINTPREIRFQNRFIVMYSGNLGPNYDFEILLKSANELKKKASDVLFIIRGYGEKASIISEYINKHQLNNVFLKTSLLSKNQLVSYLNKADIFILPLKKSEYPDASFSIKFLDYLSCGKPTICCAEGYLSDFVTGNNVGISIQPGNHEALSRAIISLKDDENTRKIMSKNARRCAVRFFSQDTIHELSKNIFMH